MMMEHYAQTVESSPWLYADARAAAARYRKLINASDSPHKGFDMMATYIASHDAGGKAFDWTPLDRNEELTQLRAVFRMACEDLERERHRIARRWWRTWWAHRIEGVRLCDRPGGYSSGHLTENILPTVDEYVCDALGYLDLLERKRWWESPLAQPDMLPNNGAERYAEDGELLAQIYAGV